METRRPFRFEIEPPARLYKSEVATRGDSAPCALFVAPPDFTFHQAPGPPGRHRRMSRLQTFLGETRKCRASYSAMIFAFSRSFASADLALLRLLCCCTATSLSKQKPRRFALGGVRHRSQRALNCGDLPYSRVRRCLLSLPVGPGTLSASSTRGPRRPSLSCHHVSFMNAMS